MSSPTGGVWMPPQASTVAPAVDHLFDFILWLNIFFFVLITALAVWFVIKYRRKTPGQRAVGQMDHSAKLEWTWTVIPSLLILGLFVWGFRVYLDQQVAPANALEIKVTAEKWKWSFTYPNGAQTIGDLHVPVGQPVKLIMSSRDVLHSFYVPSFRLKQDVVPNRYTTLWFQATETGPQQIFCAEYCGTSHSGMLGQVIVHPLQEYRDLEANNFDTGGGNKPPAEYGKELFQKFGCVACHNIDGTKNVGPALKGLVGRTESLADGTSVKADENYIRESVMDPTAKVVAGFQPIMPSFKGQVNDKQMDAIIAFIKSLQ
jgi:cytochrome c oxidase subunit 2